MKDDYKLWYDEAMNTCNEFGFAGMSTADVIKYQAEEIKELDVWSRFAGYLLDNCEGETIWEESLQYWLSEMLRKEKKLAQQEDH